MKILPLLITGVVLVLTAVWAVIDPTRLAPGLVIPLAIDTAAFVWFLWLSYQLKFVEVDNDHLYVTGWSNHVAIPLSNVATVDYHLGIKFMPRLVVVRLKSPSALGSTIYFMPTVGAAIRATLDSPSVVEDLRRLSQQTSKPTGAI